MTYKLNEIFLSIQGEGIDVGRSALFVRMSGCNQRCPFCDTDYTTKFECTPDELFGRIIDSCSGVRTIIFTGGEPLLQDPAPVLERLKGAGFRVGLETNGTLETDVQMWDTISMSPKVPAESVKLERCDSLKILFPYLNDVTPQRFENFCAPCRFIQPIDTGDAEKNRDVLNKAIQEVRYLGEGWRLGMQLHKFLGLL